MAMLDIWRNNSPRSLLDTWGSFTRDFERMFQEMDRVISPLRSSSFFTDVVNPACDIEETDSNYMLTFDMPGVAKDDINIEVQGNQLVVSGERRKVSEEKDSTSHLMERRYGQFRRTFMLPDAIDTDKIEAYYENGVLQLMVPKLEAVKPKKISIGESSGGLFKKLTGKGQEKEAETSSH